MIASYTRDPTTGKLVASGRALYRPPSPPRPRAVYRPRSPHLADGEGAHLLGTAAGVVVVGRRLRGRVGEAREHLAERNQAQTAAERRHLIASLEQPKAPPPPLGQASDRLRAAVFQGDAALVRELVSDQRTANALYSAPQGATLLFVAAQQGHAAVVEHLVATGARPDELQHDGCTPLFAAARHGHAATLELLAASSGVEVNRANFAGELPVHAAAENGHAEALRVLCANGAWLDRPSEATHKTALFGAADARSVGSVEVLADAIVRTHSFIALWLLRRGPAAMSPLQMCEARGVDWRPIAELLRAAEATGTVGAQQRLAWARVGLELLPPPPAAGEGGGDATEAPSMSLMVLRRREHRRMAGKDGLILTERLGLFAGPHSSTIVTLLGRAIGLQPPCAVAARCLAQQLAEHEMEMLGKPRFRDLDDHGYPLVIAAKEKHYQKATKSMESLSSMALAGQGQGGVGRVVGVATRVEGTRQSIVARRRAQQNQGVLDGSGATGDPSLPAETAAAATARSRSSTLEPEPEPSRSQSRSSTGSSVAKREPSRSPSPGCPAGAGSETEPAAAAAAAAAASRESSREPSREPFPEHGEAVKASAEQLALEAELDLQPAERRKSPTPTAEAPPVASLSVSTGGCSSAASLSASGGGGGKPLPVTAGSSAASLSGSGGGGGASDSSARGAAANS